MNVPVRLCVGCRRRAAAKDLLRIVVVGGVLVADPRRLLPGRGVHVHPVSACVTAADRRRAWARALRVDGPLSSAPVHTAVAQIAQQ